VGDLIKLQDYHGHFPAFLATRQWLLYKLVFAVENNYRAYYERYFVMMGGKEEEEER
jgi:hypothetical protein